MRFQRSGFAVGLTTLLATSTTHAVVLDARSVGLSDTGIANARGVESVRHNPALIHQLPKNVDNFAYNWSLGINAFDEDGFIDDLDDADEAIDELEDKSNQGNINAGDSEPTIQALQAMSGDVVQIGLDDTMVFGFPRDSDDNYSFAFTLGATADVAVSFLLNDNDVTTLRNAETSGNFDETQLVSQLRATGVAIIEAGLTAAREMTIKELRAPVTIGATLKYQDIRIIDYVEVLGNYDSLSDINDDQHRKDHTGVNIDIGAYTKLRNDLSAGLVIRNLIPRSYDGPLTAEYDSKPQLVAGVNYNTGWANVNFDLDVTKREGFSILPDRQDAKLGISFHAGRWAQLRLGYRTDFSSNYDDSVSAGFGLSVGTAFNVDLGVFKAGGESLGLGMQFGFAW